MADEVTTAGSFTFTILGKDEAIRRGPNIYGAMRARVKVALEVEMIRIAEYVRLNKLQGQVLNHRSGGLSRAVTGQIITDSGAVLVGMVGVKGIPYAGVHEFGGTFNIPGHFRVITQAFGKPVIPRMIQVRPHTATFPVRSFLRTSADENKAKFTDAMRAATGEVIRAS